jgi:transmembrane sensor
MSSLGNSGQDPEGAFDAAAAWLYRLQNDASIRNSSEFRDWMANPEHAGAFDALRSCMDDLQRLRDTPAIRQMRHAAIQRLESAPHVWRTRILAAAAVVMVAVAGSWIFLKQTATSAFTTTIGDRRTVALADGSRISLDSDTGVTVRYSRDARSIVLEKGRGRFDVAHNPTRPFTVTVGNETVVAVGTSFEVEKLRSKIVITLIQGHILIKDAGGKDQPDARVNGPVFLVAGEQMIKTADGKQTVDRVSLDAETAWEAGHLVFRGVPLADAAEQVNRYTGNPIVVDPSLSEIKISGVFNAGDAAAFVKAVTAYFPIAATTDANNAIVLSRRS